MSDHLGASSTSSDVTTGAKKRPVVTDITESPSDSEGPGSKTDDINSTNAPLIDDDVDVRLASRRALSQGRGNVFRPLVRTGGPLSPRNCSLVYGSGSGGPVRPGGVEITTMSPQPTLLEAGREELPPGRSPASPIIQLEGYRSLAYIQTSFWTCQSTHPFRITVLPQGPPGPLFLITSFALVVLFVVFFSFSPAADDDSDRLRPLPCARCLRRMVGWDPKGQAPVPRCLDTTTSSNKCTVCAAQRGKPCVPLPRSAALAALKLRQIFNDIHEETGGLVNAYWDAWKDNAVKLVRCSPVDYPCDREGPEILV
ncbi:hypothetical protein CPLU01_04212 [Colletotrichum plurivorum]|uniref:Uncharacterized protein n=1 Tax=Colletotrichum plurivorum TaxID=2175906 RepID=A0A8H6KQR2_9PEZI|nr:hypothetical protein CPLU01_04212 [Colletotrichum plurivorum]